jgi:hypothetical protein
MPRELGFRTYAMNAAFGSLVLGQAWSSQAAWPTWPWVALITAVPLEQPFAVRGISGLQEGRGEQQER